MIRRLLSALLFMLACGAAWADTPIVLYKSYAGNLNFVGAQKTMRLAGNGSNACSIASSGTTLTATIAGIPSGATVISAQLYWAGSSSTPDYSIVFEGSAVSAPANRQFTTATVGYNYFSGAADVTTQVNAKRNGTYSFSGLTVQSGTPYCAVEGVLGGFSLLVIYTVPSETFRVLNLYEGFQYIRSYGADDISVNLNLSNFKIPTPLGNATGRIAHVTWEGDSSLSGGGEKLLFNNYEMTDNANTAGNQFNSNSNIGGSADATSYGIDFDAFLLNSPRISAGQTTATLSYESGQDMVLLNAEIVAVPNVPVADLSMAMSFAGTPARGSNVTLTHTVSNQGPLSETGPIVVRHTLATGLSYVSASGTGWACTVSGQTVTCTMTTSLANGASAAPLAITAQILANAPSTMTTTASVSGAMFDNNTGNNSASHTISFSSAKYVFTDMECTPGVAFSSQQCKIISLGAQTAGQNVPFFITALDTTNRPTVPSPLAPTLYFALFCHNPVANAGVAARLILTNLTSTLNLCVTKGAAPTSSQWRSIQVSFSSGKASVPIILNYGDVGRIELLMSENNNNILTSTSGQFVSKPYKFLLTPAIANPANVTTVTASIGRFVKAGAAFTLSVTAQNYNSVATPNFGKEDEPEKVKLTAAAAPDGESSSGETFVDMEVDPPTPYPKLTGDFGPFSGGVASGSNFIWDNAGIIEVVPSMSKEVGDADGEYLEAGDVIGASIKLGRFYPDHFRTEVPIIIVCAAPHALACNGTGMHYSRQPLGTIITAHGATGTLLTFYQGKFARDTTLTALTAAGGATTSPAGAFNSTVAAASSYVKGEARVAPAFIFKETNPAWTAPVDIFIRANDADATSNRGANSKEGGTKVVKGRFLVETAFGSELLALPATLRAQYWTGPGGRWADSTKDNISVAVGTTLVHSFNSAAMELDYTKCESACTSAVVKPPTLAAASMADGLLKFRLPAPNPRTPGRYDLGIKTGPVWLPAVPGRITFGMHKTTPVIYIREIF